MLWEISGSMQCSILGTCLDEEDLLAALRKSRHGLPPGATSYEIHAHCVKMATSDNVLARTLHKLLDRRYEGALRLVSRAGSDAELSTLWDRLRDSGQTGAGYWAMLSHAHVPADLAARVFGEVHMLSHLHGRGARAIASQAADLQRRNAEMEARLRRAEAARNVALAERDAAREELAATTSALLRAHAAPIERRTRTRPTDIAAKRDRVLAAARARARHAEEEVARLRSALQVLARRQRTKKQAASVCDCCLAPAALRRLDGRRILYLGGRKNVLPHLKSAAEAREAILLVHDGGVEDNAQRIEELVGGCDAVVCPIDCISHGACKLAKSLCRRFNKPFLPISTASRSGFERALDRLSATVAGAATQTQSASL